MIHQSTRPKKIVLYILIIFLFMTGCGGNGDGLPVVNSGGPSSTPDIVKEKIADTIMGFLGIQSNPDQANITGRPRIRRKPSFLYPDRSDTKTRYKETTGFNNDVITVFGIPYTYVSGYLTISTYDSYGYPTESLYNVSKIILEWENVRVLYEKFGRSHDLVKNGTYIVSGLLPTSDKIIIEIQDYSETGTIDGIYTDFSISLARLFFKNTILYPTFESSLEAILNSNGTIYQFQCLFDGSYLVDVSVDSPVTDSFSIDLTRGTVYEAGTGFNWSPIIEESRNKVVLIRVFYDGDITPSAHGTGCVISSDGVVVTNNHVVSYGTFDKTLSNVTIEFYEDHIAHNGITYNVKGINYSGKNHDLAYLKLDLDDLDHFMIGDSSKLKRGDDLLHIGHPETLEWWESKGIFLQNTYASIENFDWLTPSTSIFQHTAPANHGSSGGAIINTKGELCGILFAGYPGEIETKARIFALHTQYIDSPSSLTFNDLSTYIPEYWILIDWDQTKISSGTVFNLPDYDNLTPMHEEMIEDISLNHYLIAYLEFYDLDRNNYADHLKLFVFDYYDFEFFWIVAWDTNGDQYMDIYALDLDFDGVAD